MLKTSIFLEPAREANAVILTKDKDFAMLLQHFGVPPRIIWLTCGNTSNAALKVLLSGALIEAVGLLEARESIVELG